MKLQNKMLLAGLLLVISSVFSRADEPVLMGQGAMGDFSKDAPGVRRLITLKDLPEPSNINSNTGQQVVKRPAGAMLRAPEGFKVEEVVSGLRNPRLIRAAPNGDIFVADSQPGRILLLRMKDGQSKPELNEVFATGLRRPFGIAFYPPGDDPRYIYIGDTDEIVRFPYENGQTKAEGKPQHIADLAGGAGQLGGGGHWTRDVIFSPDGKKMYASVGSHSNAFEDPKENNTGRAAVIEFNPDGSDMELFATGIRNPVTIAFEPKTGELWTSVNERDGIGDDLVPDYITHIQRGGYYGWPWHYMGGHDDPRHKDEHPELKDKVITPDVLLQSHSASLQMTFYTGTQFPERYRGNIFAAEHGSWNRAHKTGYKIIMVPLKDGRSDGTYEDFLTGFIMPDAKVWGRPVGITVAHDGSLLISDDGSRTIWRVSYGK